MYKTKLITKSPKRPKYIILIKT